MIALSTEGVRRTGAGAGGTSCTAVTPTVFCAVKATMAVMP
jgi:hypothetical protein